jgi:importin subunit beta-1
MSVTDIMVALASPDPAIRVPAEAAINQAKESNLASFLIALINELRDDSKPSQARQMAGMVLKNSVALHLRDVEARKSLESKWTTLPQDVRNQVKAEVLSTLGSTTREVRQIAANIIGNLSRIELPAGEWPALIETLVGAANSGSEQHMEAALTALGYVCEEASEYQEVEEYLAQFSTPILSAVGAGMSCANEDVKFYATNALCNSMEFIHANMKQQDQRDYLVQIVCDAATRQSERTREKAMECLVKIAELYYSTLPAYITKLHQLTTHAVFNDSESVALQAMLFWTSICDTERDMLDDGNTAECLNYAQTGATELVDLCLKCLVRQEDGQTEDDWNISIAGGKLLQSLSVCLGNSMTALVMPFVYANVNLENWQNCEAALMAFGCMLAGPDPKSIQDTVAQAVPGLLNYIRHKHPMVADTAGWVLSKVCELFPDVFLEVPSNLQQLLNIIGPSITSADAMAIRACNIVHNLALAYEEEEDQNTNELSPYYQDIVHALLAAIDAKGADERLHENAQETLNALVDAAAADCFAFLLTLVPELQRRLTILVEHRSQMTSASNASADLDHLIGLMCGALGGVTKKLGIRMREHIAATIQIMDNIFKMHNDSAQAEALIAVGALAHAVQTDLLPYIHTVMPYIVYALQQVDQEDLCHTAAGTLGDCATSLQEQFAPFAEQPLVVIRDCLTNPLVDRDVKCSLLGCIGDVALALGGDHFFPYLSTFCQIVSDMYEQSKKIDIKGDYDAEEYVYGLWESIASLYTGVCQCFNGCVHHLVPYLQGILIFAMEVANASREQYEVLAAALGVIGDLANILTTAEPSIRQSGKNSLLNANVRELIGFARKIRDEGVHDQVEWVGKQLAGLEHA